MAAGDLYRKNYKKRDILGRTNYKPDMTESESFGYQGKDRFNATKTYSNVNVHPKRIKPHSQKTSVKGIQLGSSNTQTGVSTIGGSNKRSTIKTSGANQNINASRLKSRGKGNVYGTDRIESTSTTPKRVSHGGGFMDAIHRQRKVRGR